jgi:UDP:flavonoid glycosyltransferase YjiC (YdhE family)
MRVVFSRWGSTGDVLPYTSVAVELSRRGHRVVFAGNEHYADMLAGAAVEFVRVGTRDDHARLMRDVEVFDRRRKSAEQIFHNHYYPHLEAFYQATAAECRRDGGALVVGGEAGSAAAAERTGAPYVHLACSPGTSPFVRSRFDPLHPERVLSPPLRWLARDGKRRALMYFVNNLLRRRITAPAPTTVPADHPLGRLRAREGMPLTPGLVPLLALCMWPDWFAAAQPDWPAYAKTMDFPFRSTPVWNRSSAAPGDGPVIATTGTIAGSQSRFYTLVVDACRLLNKSAVLVTPHRDQIPEALPAGIEWRRFARFEELFSEASLVIHHGGIGTAALAIAAGVPQVVVPMRGDQFDNSYRLESLGVARLLSLSGMTAAALARILSSTMESRRLRDRCRYYQQHIDGQAGVRKTADAIEAALGIDVPSPASSPDPILPGQVVMR